VDTAEKVRKYLHADVADLYDPFLMKGMREAVDRLRLAIDEKQKVVIYGDYDADGICASAILSLYLSSCGLDVYAHIPNRVGDGYGLNVESIESIIEKCCPDLILTCDCGISGSAEVAYAMDLGVDVIVTDHHEVAEVIPECIVVNPKQSDCSYPYSQLCGAGVALKLVQALGGQESAVQFTDLAAVATIADLVPLLDENRLIVQLGLKKLEEKNNLGLRLLIEDQKLTYPVLSGDIAYKIAPRINAAGRMGDAYRSFELLTTDNTQRAQAIVCEINEDNARRKQLCDKLYNEAIVDLRYENLIDERAVILSNPEWEKGITGILAARLAGDFHRPAFVMVNSGEYYKGTSRSIPGINIYELLSSVGDILVEFGGHSQAAGFSIEEKNIPAFRKRVNAFIAAFPIEMFELSQEYDMELSADELDLSLARALECIEPSGNSNTRPLFRTTVSRLNVAPCKNNHAHTNITCENGFQILAFNFYEQNQFLLGDTPKDLILELQLSNYGGRESAKGYLKAAVPTQLYVNDAVAKANYFKTLSYGITDGDAFLRYAPDMLPAAAKDKLFGVLLIAGSKQTYEAYVPQLPSDKFLHEFLYPTSVNNYSRIIVAPEIGDIRILSGYDTVVFLDTPPGYALAGYLQKKTKAKIYVPQNDNQAQFYENVHCSREAFGLCFDALRKCTSLSADNILSYYKLLQARYSIDIHQFIAGIMVFAELGLITVGKNPFSVAVNRDVRADLQNSAVYGFLCERSKEK
ncbi:MAG: single-stranded-DNA-specific exonuclease RecJ, partial [Clostridiales bacterium]|nr:single-stranded-DNA-specific exonuclease RecJ [Clostridiales bacterium]